MAELERIDAGSEAWLDKLEHIRGAVLHHMFEEEGSWFIELHEQYDDQAFLTERFREEYERYTGSAEADATALAAGEPRTFRDPGAAPYPV